MMWGSIGLFVVALFLILAAAVFFTNGVEWLGKRFKLSEGGVGSVLAAVGTALPETVVPLVAILWVGDAEGVDVGIGAIIGAPFMLATLTLPLAAIWIAFLAVLKRRERTFYLNSDVPRIDLGYFLPSFTLAVLASILPFQIVKYLVAFVLIGIYVRYLRVILATGEVIETSLAPLYFARSASHPVLPLILLQVLLALGIMVLGAHLFVDAVKISASMLGLSPLVLSLLVTPVATELPEKFNSLVWITQKKDTLAVGNITGAMVFQGTIPVSIGLLFTPWQLNHYSLVSATLAITAALAYFLVLKGTGLWRPWQLATGALLYGGFGLYVWMQWVP